MSILAGDNLEPPESLPKLGFVIGFTVLLFHRGIGNMQEMKPMLLGRGSYQR